MTPTTGSAPPRFGRRPLQSLLAAPGTRTITVAVTDEPGANVNILVVPPERQTPELAVKIATTGERSQAVEQEARILVDLRRMELGLLRGTIPRFVQVCEHEGRSALVASALPGVPLARAYATWPHIARPGHVAGDFAAAGEWLARFQDATFSAPAPVDLLTGAAARVRRLAGTGPGTTDLADRVERTHELLAAHTAPRSAVHGDFWFGNLLVDRPGTGRVTGVVDWEGATTRGEPLRDLGRFAVTYSAHLDRRTPAGLRVPGHWRLRADHDGAAIVYGLSGTGWYPRLVRSFLSDGLRRLGLPEELWYAVAWAALAEMAAAEPDLSVARRHVRTLSRLPEAGAPQDRSVTTTP